MLLETDLRISVSLENSWHHIFKYCHLHALLSVWKSSHFYVGLGCAPCISYVLVCVFIALCTQRHLRLTHIPLHSISCSRVQYAFKLTHGILFSYCILYFKSVHFKNNSWFVAPVLNFAFSFPYIPRHHCFKKLCSATPLFGVLSVFLFFIIFLLFCL